jgi:hypothetical protein
MLHSENLFETLSDCKWADKDAAQFFEHLSDFCSADARIRGNCATFLEKILKKPKGSVSAQCQWIWKEKVHPAITVACCKRERKERARERERERTRERRREGEKERRREREKERTREGEKEGRREGETERRKKESEREGERKGEAERERKRAR